MMANPTGGWLPIASAPLNATTIRVKMADGTVYGEAHWASDLSGEDQPPFEGWFRPVYSTEYPGRISYMLGIPEPRWWLPK